MAETLSREAADTAFKAFGANHPQTIAHVKSYAHSLIAQGLLGIPSDTPRGVSRNSGVQYGSRKCSRRARSLSILVQLLGRIVGIVPKFKFNNIARFDAQSSEEKGTNYYKWKVYSDEEPDRLALVEAVEYHLHTTFKNPIRTIKNRNSRFALISRGWGEFTIQSKCISLMEEQFIHIIFCVSISLGKNNVFDGNYTKSKLNAV